MTLSATLAIDEESNRRQAAGLPVLPMGFGEVGLPVHRRLQAALADNTHLGGYGPVVGAPELREAAAGYWQRRLLPTRPSQVIVGPGSKPLLLAALMALPGAVALPQPSWVSYAAQAQMIGRPSHHVAVLPNQGGVPDPAALDALATQARADGEPLAAVVVTLPDNPTGTLASPDTVRLLCAVAEEHDLVVISDEIYRDLVHDVGTPFLSPAEVSPHRTLVTTGLSKNLAVGGWRIGVARMPDGALGERLGRAIASSASEIWSVASAPVQQAAALAFTEPPALVERIRCSRLLHGQVAQAAARVLRAHGADVPEPRGAFYLYPDFESRRADLVALGIHDGPGLARALMDGPGIATLPGSAFGDDPEALRLRLATGRLYGDTVERQTIALNADDPLALPWIDALLADLHDGLAQLLGDSEARAS